MRVALGVALGVVMVALQGCGNEDEQKSPSKDSKQQSDAGAQAQQEKPVETRTEAEPSSKDPKKPPVNGHAAALATSLQGTGRKRRQNGNRVARKGSRSQSSTALYDLSEGRALLAEIQADFLKAVDRAKAKDAHLYTQCLPLRLEGECLSYTDYTLREEENIPHSPVRAGLWRQLEIWLHSESGLSKEFPQKYRFDSHLDMVRLKETCKPEYEAELARQDFQAKLEKLEQLLPPETLLSEIFPVSLDKRQEFDELEKKLLATWKAVFNESEICSLESAIIHVAWQLRRSHLPGTVHSLFKANHAIWVPAPRFQALAAKIQNIAMSFIAKALKIRPKDCQNFASQTDHGTWWHCEDPANVIAKKMRELCPECHIPEWDLSKSDPAAEAKQACLKVLAKIGRDQFEALSS